MWQFSIRWGQLFISAQVAKQCSTCPGPIPGMHRRKLILIHTSDRVVRANNIFQKICSAVMCHLLSLNSSLMDKKELQCNDCMTLRRNDSKCVFWGLFTQTAQGLKQCYCRAQTDTVAGWITSRQEKFHLFPKSTSFHLVFPWMMFHIPGKQLWVMTTILDYDIILPFLPSFSTLR